MSHGFPPIAGPGARMLVLGTLPSVMSLERQQYYGNPRNAFWPIMGELFGTGPETPYGERAARLIASGVAVWDVLASAEREGSGDDAIERATAVANDIAGLIAREPGITTICFNGGVAEDLFRRFVLPGWPNEPDLPEMIRLPSTSPKNARLDFAAKLDAWRIVARRAERP